MIGPYKLVPAGAVVSPGDLTGKLKPGTVGVIPQTHVTQKVTFFGNNRKSELTQTFLKVWPLRIFLMM